MAKKAAASKINKSELIRSYAAEHPEAKPKAIAEALSSQTGEAFSSASVSTVLFNAKKKGTDGNGTMPLKKGKPGRKPKAPSKAAGGTGAAEAITAAAALVKAAGGPQEAQAILAALIGVMG